MKINEFIEKVVKGGTDNIQKESEEAKSSITTYTKTLECENCDTKQTVEIPKGTTVWRFQLFHKCNCCGVSNHYNTL